MTDERFEEIVSKLLLTGVLLSAAVVLLGGACYVLQHAHDPVAYRPFQAQSAAYRSVAAVAKASVAGDCRAVIQLGLLLLIATPVARVAFSLVAFSVQRDRTYIIVTSIVLAILLFSLVSGY
jgi:uncharacterized membrane protein